jgi:hypothetical protein
MNPTLYKYKQGQVMTKNVEIKVSKSGNGFSIQDNKGNSFKLEEGFANVTCDGKKQDINVAKVGELAAGLGYQVGEMAATQKAVPPATPAPKFDATTPQTKKEHWSFKQAANTAAPVATPIPAAPSIGAGLGGSTTVGGALDGLKGLVKNVKSVSVTLEEGLPSPLTNVCKQGQDAKIIHPSK